MAATCWDVGQCPATRSKPTRNLKQLAVRLGWAPAHGGWTCNGQWFSTRKDFEGLAAGLSTSAYQQLKLDGQSQKEDRKAALNAALG
eukprot:5105284-Amphidinium_carterae.1